MSFAVEDFHDLARLLGEHPEWRAELRRLVLSEELLAVPEILQRLAQAQARTEARIEELAQAQARTEARLDVLAGKIDELVTVVSKLAGEQPGIKGFIVESKYEKRPFAYFAPIARRLRTIDINELDRLLDRAESEGLLDESQADEIRLADIVARGKLKDDGSEVWLVVEASWVVDRADVERAVNRSRLLSKIGLQTLPVVAGEAIEYEAKVLANKWGAWKVTNGSVEPPKEPNGQG
ncbi:MAG: hypothetical protein ACRDIU_10350 [Actinomycetota bacterium]